MKIERLISAHKNKSPIACFFRLLLILLLLSLSIGVTHAFARERISGYVRTSSGNEISGVTIRFNNGEGTSTTNSSGYYSQYVKKDWSGTATPSKVGYNFDPASRSYSKVKKNQPNQDYTGIIQTRTISGYVRTSSGNGLGGVTVTFDNGGGTGTTNSSGYYSREVNYGWGGTVTPSLDGYSFIPASRSYVDVIFNLSNQDYTGIVQTRIISGYILTLSGNGCSGATVTFDNGGGTETTDSSGYYNREVTYGWGGTVTPSKDDYSFVPASRSFVNVIFNQSNQDYTGTQEQSEPSSNLEVRGDDGDDGYGCFVGCLH